ncbi:MAG: hypothetical protein AAF518_10480, partial [Spirochaetota bacterium]
IKDKIHLPESQKSDFFRQKLNRLLQKKHVSYLELLEGKKLIVIHWSNNQETVHTFPNGKKTKYTSKQAKKKTDSWESPFDYRDKLAERGLASRLKKAEALELGRNRIYTADINGKNRVRITIYKRQPLRILRANSIVFKKKTKKEMLWSGSNESLSLAVSPKEKFLVLYQRGNKNHILLDARTLKLIRKLQPNAQASPYFSNETFLSFPYGCVCEGQEGRATTIYSLQDLNQEIDISFKKIAGFKVGKDFLAIYNSDLDGSITVYDEKLKEIPSKLKREALTTFADEFSAIARDVLIIRYREEINSVDNKTKFPYIRNNPIVSVFEDRNTILTASSDSTAIRLIRQNKSGYKTILHEKVSFAFKFFIDRRLKMLVVVDLEGHLFKFRIPQNK